MRQPQSISIPFPLKGLDENWAKRDQPERSTFDCLNVRPYDYDGRVRGGQRPGLSKYVGTQISGANRVQDINHVTTAVAGAAVQTALSIRGVTCVAVSDGDMAKLTSSTVTAATGGTNVLTAGAPVIFSAAAFGKLYYCDGAKYVVYDPATNTASTWTPSAGSLPVVTPTGYAGARLICNWRGRIVLSGTQGDAHNWFMSAKGDPLNWNYAPVPDTETQAVAGNNSPAGKIGQVINTLIPYNDDVLLFGCDSSIWQMSGDPMAGGRLDMVTDTTGMSWGRPWCMSPQGTIYFFGSRGGVYRLAPGGMPEKITAARIDARLASINLDTNLVRLAWDDEFMGVHVFITPLTAGETQHYWWDARADSWWVDEFVSSNHNPVAIHTYDGDASSDRVLMLGGQDGYIRHLDDDADDDDGEIIHSYVFIGPIQVDTGSVPFVLAELQAELDTQSSNVKYRIFAGDCAEDAANGFGGGYLLNEDGGVLLMESGGGLLLESTAPSGSAYYGEFSPRRSTAVNPRVRAYAVYVSLGNNNADETWSMEVLRGKLHTITSSKRRRL